MDAAVIATSQQDCGSSHRICFPDLVEIRRFADGRGRGLVARRGLPRGTFVCRAPCLRLPLHEYQNHVRHTVLEHYVFSLRCGDVLVALGWGSLFNHDANPNVSYSVCSARTDASHDGDSIDFVTARDVRCGEELCIYYGPRPAWDGDGDADGGGANGSDHDSDDSGGERVGLVELGA